MQNQSFYSIAIEIRIRLYHMLTVKHTRKLLQQNNCHITVDMGQLTPAHMLWQSTYVV